VGEASSCRAPAAARGWRIVGALALLGLVLGLYRPVVDYDYVSYDDPQYVSDNPAVLAGLTREGVRWAFAVHPPSMWVPLTWLSYMGVVSVAGAGPAPQHAVNVALHAAAVLMLYAFLLSVPAFGGCTGAGAVGGSAGARSPGWGVATSGAWAVAALWAVHPLHVESVAWITERKDVLAGAFWMLTLLAYRRYVARAGAGRYALVVAAGTFAMLAKPLAVTLPLVLLLLDVWPLGRLGTPHGAAGGRGFPPVPPWRAVLEKLPLLAMAGVTAAMTLRTHANVGALGSLEQFPLQLRAGNALVSYAAYLWRMFWPVGLAPYYPYPENVPAPAVVTAVLVLGGLSAAALRGARRHPAAAVGWVWFLGVMVPMIGIVQGGQPLAMADRFAYLPAVGIYLAVMSLALEWAAPSPRRRVGLAVAVALVLALLGATARRQLGHWRDSEALIRHTVAATAGAYEEPGTFARNAGPRSPGRWFLRLHLGIALVGKGRLEEGIAELERASALDPSDPLAHYHLGVAFARLGRPGRAAEEFRAALARAPGNVPSLTGLAQIEIDAGRPAGALPLLEKAAGLVPGHAWVRDRLGVALALSGRPREGLVQLEEASRLAPWDAEIRRHLGQARELAAGVPPARTR